MNVNIIRKEFAEKFPTIYMYFFEELDDENFLRVIKEHKRIAKEELKKGAITQETLQKLGKLYENTSSSESRI